MSDDKFKWVVQHEFDFEPTYIVDDETGETIAEMSADIPWEKRLKNAQLIVTAVNCLVNDPEER